MVKLNQKGETAMNTLLVIPMAVILALTVIQTLVTIHYARRGMEDRQSVRVIDSVFTGIILLTVLSLEPLAAQMWGVGLYMVLRFGGIFYVEGKLRGKGMAAVKKDLPMVLAGFFVLWIILWGLDHFL